MRTVFTLFFASLMIVRTIYVGFLFKNIKVESCILQFRNCFTAFTFVYSDILENLFKVVDTSNLPQSLPKNTDGKNRQDKNATETKNTYLIPTNSFSLKLSNCTHKINSIYNSSYRNSFIDPTTKLNYSFLLFIYTIFYSYFIPRLKFYYLMPRSSIENSSIIFVQGYRKKTPKSLSFIKGKFLGVFLLYNTYKRGEKQ